MASGREGGSGAERQYLARAGSGLRGTAAETLLLATSVGQCPSQVAVTGHTVRKVSVPQGALVAGLSTKCRLTRAMASEHITLLTG